MTNIVPNIPYQVYLSDSWLSSIQHHSEIIIPCTIQLRFLLHVQSSWMVWFRLFYYSCYSAHHYSRILCDHFAQLDRKRKNDQKSKMGTLSIHRHEASKLLSFNGEGAKKITFTYYRWQKKTTDYFLFLKQKVIKLWPDFNLPVSGGNYTGSQTQYFNRCSPRCFPPLA